MLRLIYLPFFATMQHQLEFDEKKNWIAAIKVCFNVVVGKPLFIYNEEL